MDKFRSHYSAHHTKMTPRAWVLGQDDSATTLHVAPDGPQRHTSSTQGTEQWGGRKDLGTEASMLLNVGSLKVPPVQAEDRAKLSLSLTKVQASTTLIILDLSWRGWRKAGICMRFLVSGLRLVFQSGVGLGLLKVHDVII